MQRKLILAASAVLFVITVAYANHFLTGLHFGDSTSIRDNSSIRRLANIPRFFFDSSTSASDPVDYSYRPIVTLSYAIDYFVGRGVAPLVMHVASFLVFLAGLAFTAWLFFLVFERAIPHPWNPYLAIMGTALFGLHPAVAEMLNPLSERGEMYAAFGVVAGVALYAGLPAKRRFALYLIPPTLGVLSNPAGMVFGPLLLAYILFIEPAPTYRSDDTLTPDQLKSRDETQSVPAPLPAGSGPKRIRIRRRKHPLRRYLKAQLERFMPALLFTVVAGLLHSLVTPFNTNGEVVTNYWFTQPWVASRYFRSFFFPSHLSPASDLTVFNSYHIEAVLGLAFVLALISIALIVAVSPNWRPSVFGIWWFLIGILPGAILMQGDVEKDTRMFLPFMGLALSVTWAARMLLPRGEPLRRLEAIVAIGILFALAFGTYSRNRVWSDEETLWHDTVVKNPSSVRGLQNYALVLVSKGRAAEAYEYLRRARFASPKSSEVEAAMGTTCAALNRDEEAEGHFRRALSLGADKASSYYPFAVWLEKQGVADRAQLAYSWASSLAPSDMRPRYGLMRTYQSLRDWNNLRGTAAAAMEILPGDQDSARFAEIARNQPDDLKVAQALVKDHPTPENYLTLSEALFARGDYQQSLEAAQKALELRPGFGPAFNDIGAAYMSLGRLDDAIGILKKALELDPDNKSARANLNELEHQKLVVGNGIMRQ
jgi:Flp pilus assembly protein TadD